MQFIYDSIVRGVAKTKQFTRVYFGIVYIYINITRNLETEFDAMFTRFSIEFLVKIQLNLIYSNNWIASTVSLFCFFFSCSFIVWFKYMCDHL